MAREGPLTLEPRFLQLHRNIRGNVEFHDLVKVFCALDTMRRSSGTSEATIFKREELRVDGGMAGVPTGRYEVSFSC